LSKAGPDGHPAEPIQLGAGRRIGWRQISRFAVQVAAEQLPKARGEILRGRLDTRIP
jgi:hypothetical protein